MREQEKVIVVDELRRKYSLREFFSIFHENKGRYGYRRIALELKNRGFIINYKTVYNLMKILGLQSTQRPKRKYTSYIRKSMSRKGNCLDNGCAENFFSIIKSEMFYPKEKQYINIEELEKDIIEYLEYYNNVRIKCKLKGISPVQYRKHSCLVA